MVSHDEAHWAHRITQKYFLSSYPTVRDLIVGLFFVLTLPARTNASWQAGTTGNLIHVLLPTL
jgi:hypothetical protein